MRAITGMGKLRTASQTSMRQRGRSLGFRAREGGHLGNVRAADEGLVAGARDDKRAQALRMAKRCQYLDEAPLALKAQRIALSGIVER